jgi:hypothetical protein
MSISDIPRQELCILVANYGRGLCDDPQRCEALLRDYCGNYRREITLLVNAMREQVPQDLMSTEGRVPYEILRSRLIKQLEENLAITNEAAAWSVDAWAAALEINAPQASGSSGAGFAEPAGSHGTQMERLPNLNPNSNPPVGSAGYGSSDPGYRPTEVASGSSGGLSGGAANNYPNSYPGAAPSYPNGGSAAGGAAVGGTGSGATHIRGDVPAAPPTAPYPNTYSPTPGGSGGGSGGGSKPNYVLFGVLGGFGLLLLAGLAGLIAVIAGGDSAEMRAALKEAKAHRTDKEFAECVDVLKPYKDKEKAKELSNLCQLDLAQQTAARGEFMQAIREAKLVAKEPDAKVYRRAQSLIDNWSEGREVKFENGCNHPIELAIMFADPKNDLKPRAEGVWRYTANEGYSFLAVKDKRVRVLDPIYFFAEATDGSGWRWEGDKKVTLGDRVYRMRLLPLKLDPKDGSFISTLTCTGN